MMLRFTLSDTDAKSLVYHVHFPGTSELKSDVVPKDGIVRHLNVPVGATAVCVTIVKRMKKGWVRHSRCRFDGSEEEQILTLKDEQLGTGNPAYGKVTLSLNNKLNEDRQILTREWFDIPNASLEVFERSENEWFKHVKPIDTIVKKIHAPWWNNHAGVRVPGWCFAFPPLGENVYSVSDMKEMFKLADNMLNVSGHMKTSTLSYSEEKMSEILALGLTLHGLSIFYESDHTVRDEKVIERFSSTARLDGLGDCEDIAKESGMVISDLKNNTSEVIDMFMSRLKMVAMGYQYCICLGTVRRSPGRDFEAHAFGMLIPNALFPDEMLTETEQICKQKQNDSMQVFRSYMCDGVYDCHPTKKKVASGQLNKDDQRGPWQYEKIVEAFVMNKGLVYFGTDDRYGLRTDKLFPIISKDVKITNALGNGATFLERRDAARAVLSSNLPRATRTYGLWNEAPIRRFEDVTINTSNRALKILDTFKDTMHPRTQRKLEAYVQKKKAACLSKNAFKELRDHIPLHVDGDGDLVKSEPFSLYNPPTPQDFISFVTKRVFALLNTSETENKLLHDANLFMTEKHAYDMNDKGSGNSIVTEMFFKFNLEKGVEHDETDETKVCYAVCRCIKARLCDSNESYITISEDGTFILNKSIFSKKNDHDMYLNEIEEKIDIRCTYEDISSYTNRCMIEKEEL